MGHFPLRIETAALSFDPTNQKFIFSLTNEQTEVTIFMKSFSQNSFDLFLGGKK
jgi:hypothetical protein